MNNPIIETERLLLREMILSDKEELAMILCDNDTMKYYPSPFSLQKVEKWIQWNIDNYKKYRHGLWTVIRKDDHKFLGDCGITMQEIEGVMLPEIGYHIHKSFWGKGYATEAAEACINYAFETLNYSVLVSYTKFDNKASIRVAEKNGFKFVKFFDKVVMGENVQEVLYQINRL